MMAIYCHGCASLDAENIRIRAVNTELVAALEMAINWIGGNPHGLSPKNEKSIRAALAKARGEG